MLGGPCSQHVTGNTLRQNQPQSAIIEYTIHRYMKLNWRVVIGHAVDVTHILSEFRFLATDTHYIE